MANTKSALKALRQDKKRAARNTGTKKKIEYFTKQITRAVEGKDASQAEKLFVELQKTLDKATKRKVVHRNAAARTKSRIQTKVNTLKK